MTLIDCRKQFHDAICHDLLKISKSKKKNGDYPNNADGDSAISVKIAWGILNRITEKPIIEKMSGQSAGRIFEQLIKEYIENAFGLLQHIRPGNWKYYIETEITQFEQYKDLAEVEKVLKSNKKLATTFGQDYIIKPDIVISREPISTDKINEIKAILKNEDEISKLTPFIKSNFDPWKELLHASISCKWTLRSDRAQNIRTEAFNLIRHRKGHIPHIVAVTGEPTLTRIASLALGTGDIDCVYHFALHELKETLDEIQDESQLDMYAMLVEGKRLRDISDLPFDLAV